MFKRRKEKKDPMETAMALTQYQERAADPQGSYTGTPANPAEVPVQDADDL